MHCTGPRVGAYSKTDVESVPCADKLIALCYLAYCLHDLQSRSKYSYKNKLKNIIIT